jgi:hypothetical protein
MRLRILLCAGCLLLASGCAFLAEQEQEAPADTTRETPEPAPWMQPGGAPVNDVETLVQYFGYIRKLAPADLTREFDGARQEYNRARSEYSRVRFAMLLSLPAAPFNDDGRALDVLEPVLRNGNGRLYPLAQLLGSQIQEQKRLNASVQGLQQKLDALKSLERSIIERSR